MKAVSISMAEEIYACATSLTIYRREVEHKLFGEYCFELGKLIRSLGDAAEDAYWEAFLRPLRRYRFESSAAPLPFSHHYLRGPLLTERLRDHLTGCERIFAEFSAQARHVFDLFSELASSHDNPLLIPIMDVADGGKYGDCAILTVRPGLVGHVESVTRANPRLRGVRTVGVSQLRDEPCRGRLIVLGPACWFPEHVFTAPRAREIDIIRYAWLPDQWRSEALFLGGSEGEVWSASSRVAEMLSAGSGPDRQVGAPVFVLDSEEVMPRIDWESIKRRADLRQHGVQSDNGDVEHTEAFLLMLEGDMAVLLDSSEGARTTIIDIDQEIGALVRRSPVADVEPEMFVLLRTEGGGEYIVEAANKILGEEAAHARGVQAHWKALLKQDVARSSPRDVVAELRRHGSTRANETNLRNWMSYRSIRTDDRRDFEAIMHLVGLSDSADDYWATMTQIDSAHRMAGQLIRRLLLREVRALNTQDLVTRGRADFELPEAGAGSLTAFRVRYIPTESVVVPVHRLGKVFDLEIE